MVLKETRSPGKSCRFLDLQAGVTSLLVGAARQHQADAVLEHVAGEAAFAVEPCSASFRRGGSARQEVHGRDDGSVAASSHALHQRAGFHVGRHLRAASAIVAGTAALPACSTASAFRPGPPWLPTPHRSSARSGAATGAITAARAGQGQRSRVHAGPWRGKRGRRASAEAGYRGRQTGQDRRAARLAVAIPPRHCRCNAMFKACCSKGRCRLPRRPGRYRRNPALPEADVLVAPAWSRPSTTRTAWHSRTVPRWCIVAHGAGHRRRRHRHRKPSPPGHQQPVSSCSMAGAWADALGLPGRARPQGRWLVKLPARPSRRQAMAIGTASYAAMLCVLALERHGLGPAPAMCWSPAPPAAWAAWPRRCWRAPKAHRVVAVTSGKTARPPPGAKRAQPPSDRAELRRRRQSRCRRSAGPRWWTQWAAHAGQRWRRRFTAAWWRPAGLAQGHGPAVQRGTVHPARRDAGRHRQRDVPARAACEQAWARLARDLDAGAAGGDGPRRSRWPTRSTPPNA